MSVRTNKPTREASTLEWCFSLHLNNIILYYGFQPFFRVDNIVCWKGDNDMLCERTIEAMIEAKRIAKDSSVKGYMNVGKLLVDLKQEEEELKAMEDE